MSPHILIVEDHQGVRQSLREWLELSFPGYRLLEATSGEEAVILAQAMCPCLVIMDIGLPGMSGIEAAQGIKAAVPATRVVMLTILTMRPIGLTRPQPGSAPMCPSARSKRNFYPSSPGCWKRIAASPS